MSGPSTPEHKTHDTEGPGTCAFLLLIPDMWTGGRSSSQIVSQPTKAKKIHFPVLHDTISSEGDVQTVVN